MVDLQIVSWYNRHHFYCRFLLFIKQLFLRGSRIDPFDRLTVFQGLNAEPGTQYYSHQTDRDGFTGFYWITRFFEFKLDGAKIAPAAKRNADTFLDAIYSETQIGLVF